MHRVYLDKMTTRGSATVKLRRPPHGEVTPTAFLALEAYGGMEYSSADLDLIMVLRLRNAINRLVGDFRAEYGETIVSQAEALAAQQDSEAGR